MPVHRGGDRLAHGIQHMLRGEFDPAAGALGVGQAACPAAEALEPVAEQGRLEARRSQVDREDHQYPFSQSTAIASAMKSATRQVVGFNCTIESGTFGVTGPKRLSRVISRCHDVVVPATPMV